MDKITIAGLRVRGRHGVFEHERATGQEFLVDAVLYLDTGPAAAADDLARTADYGVIAHDLAEIVAGEPVALIETLAARLADACLADQAVREVEITVHKPQAPVGLPITDIAVTVHRSSPRLGSPVAGSPVAGSPVAGSPVAGSPVTGAGRSGVGAARQVVLALGSNLGDRLANLQQGVAVLCRGGLRCTAVSAVFETAPVGGPDQDDYFNAVLLADSSLPAAAILARCREAEAAVGRVRTVRWGPRTLDADIIACGMETSSDPDLTLPHPRAHERAFVLAPWLDVAPDAALPGHGSVASLLARAPGRDGVRRLRPGEACLTLPGGAREADIRCG